MIKTIVAVLTVVSSMAEAETKCSCLSADGLADSEDATFCKIEGGFITPYQCESNEGRCHWGPHEDPICAG
jgi:hypothetical protein